MVEQAGMAPQKQSPSVYLQQPSVATGSDEKGQGRKHLHQAAWPSETASNLDTEPASVWLNDLAFDTFSTVAGGGKTSKGALHYGHIASVQRHVELSSCALILSLLYAERLHRTYNCRTPNASSSNQSTEAGPDRTCQSPSCEPNTDDVFWTEENDSNHLSSSDLFLMSMLLANKYLYDEGEYDALWNSDLAEAGRRKLKTVHKLEALFLNLLQWRLFVSRAEFDAFVVRVERVLALRAILDRGGSLLYQDIDRLWDVVVSQASVVLRTLLKVIVVCSSVYLAVALVVLLSPSVVSLVGRQPRVYVGNVSADSSNQTLSQLAVAPPSNLPDIRLPFLAQKNFDDFQTRCSTLSYNIPRKISFNNSSVRRRLFDQRPSSDRWSIPLGHFTLF